MKARKPKERKSKVRKLIIRLLIALVIVVALFVAVFWAAVELSPFDKSKLTQTSSPTIIYDKNGNQYAQIASPRSSDLTAKQVPKNLQNALVAIEDHNFWNSSSIDAKGILRSAFVDLWSGSYAQGGSTIQEQLAKVVYLTEKKTFTRKFQQIVLGVQINRHFTKPEILAMYLNRVYLGQGAVGVEQAAQVYYGVDLAKGQKLTLDQAAMLAGLPQAPSGYDPIVYPKAAEKRRNEVLAAMAKYGYITESAAKKAEAVPVPTNMKEHKVKGDIWASHPLLAQFLLDDADTSGIDRQALLQGGLKVYTTIDPKVQNALKTVFWNSKNYNGHFAPSVHGTPVPAAAVFVDPKTGGILGAAGAHGGDTTAVHGLDRALEYGQPGSSIKPVLDYGPALETGKWTPNSILHNEKQNFGNYSPSNDEPNQPARVTMSYALKESENIAAVWMLQQIGISTGIKYAESDGLHFTQKDSQSLGIAIGGMEKGVTPAQMAQAYEAFDNQGIQEQEHLFTKIINADGQTIYSFQPAAKLIWSQKTVAWMTQMLMGVVQGGTGTGAQIPGWDVAGKTGTVQYDKGISGSHPSWIRLAWFDGYTPNMVGSIYMGWNNDESGKPEYHTTGVQSYYCSQIFSDVVKLAEQGVSPQHFNFGTYNLGATGAAVTHLQGVWNPAGGVQLSWKSAMANQVQFVVTRTDKTPPGGPPNAPPDNTTNGTAPNGTTATGAGSGPVKLIQTPSMTFTDTSAQPGHTYLYSVQAVDGSGQPVGNAATVTVAAPPGGGPGNTGANATGNTTGTPPGNTTGGTNPPGTGTGNTTIPNPTGGAPGSGGGGNTTAPGGGVGNTANSIGLANPTQ